MKKFTDEYMDSRAKELKRFLDYCLVSETINQDMLYTLTYKVSLDVPSGVGRTSSSCYLEHDKMMAMAL